MSMWHRFQNERSEIVRYSTLLISLAVLLLSACSVSTLGRRETDADSVKEEIKSRILELQRKAAVTDVELELLRQELARLDALLRRQAAAGVEAAGTTTGPGVSEASSRSGPPAALGLEESDLELTPVAPPAGRAGGPLQEPSALPSPVAPPPAGGADAVGYRPVEPAAQALYDRGYTQFHQGRYLDAESTFQRFLQAYPETELADNAQYWIGECRFARGDLRSALAAFRETLRRYPEGNKVPDALLKEGTCLERLGDREGARLRYDEVLRRFPGSAAAAIAQERRASLG